MFKFEDPRYITAVVLMAFGGFAARSRIMNNSIAQTSYPLLFWGLIIWYATSFEGFFELHVLYAGLLLSALCKFEFMPLKLLAVIRYLEVAMIAVTAYFGLQSTGIWTP